MQGLNPKVKSKPPSPFVKPASPTVLEVIDLGTKYLDQKQVESARTNMQLLVAHHLDCTRTGLYLQFDHPVEEHLLEEIRSDLKKRGSRIPLQHLLGEVPFHRLEFKTDARALIPRPETEELVELILKTKLPTPCRLLDMGTGSGVIGLSLVNALGEQCQEAILADVSKEALELASENTQALKASSRVSLVESHLFDQIEGTFDLIIANLPYIPLSDEKTLSPEVQHDPKLALFGGKDGLDIIRDFIPKSFSALNPGGMLFLEIGIHQSTEVEALLTQAGFDHVMTHSDLNQIPRFPSAQKPL